MLKPAFVAVGSVAEGATVVVNALPPNCNTCAGKVELEGEERPPMLIAAAAPIPAYVVPAIFVENVPGSELTAGGAEKAGASGIHGIVKENAKYKNRFCDPCATKPSKGIAIASPRFYATDTRYTDFAQFKITRVK